MELLTYVGQAAKRKARFEERAENLMLEFPSVDELEGEMLDRTKGLVRRVSDQRMRFSEFQRAAADDTVTAALAGVMLGDQRGSSLKDETYAKTLRTMPYLWEFYREIDWSLKNGKLSYGEYDPDGPESIDLPESKRSTSPSKGARRRLDERTNLGNDIIDVFAGVGTVPVLGKSRPTSWKGVESRLKNYLSTPVYSWFSFGEMENKRRTGFRQCRRVLDPQAKHCPDCLAWASMGFQPMGMLPPPGERCKCLFNCRCAMEYR